MKLYTNNNTYKIYQGSMLDLLEVIEKNTIDSVVTDPPYELNFMNKGWDRSGIAFQKDTWEKCYQALKPGGYLLAFGGSRTFHRIAVAIEDAGFEIRDVIMWVYGQGFPKSTDILKQLNSILKLYESEIEHEKNISREQKTKYNMRPLWETYIQTSKFITKEQWKILQSGLSQQSSYEAMLREKSKESDEDGKEPCVEGWSYIQTTEGELQWCKICESTSRIFRYGKERWLYNGAPFSDGNSFEKTFKEDGGSSSHRPQSKQQQFREPYVVFLERRAQEIRGKIEEYDGWGTSLKPAYEPIIVARKPLKGTVAQNVMQYGVGAINIDECRVGTTGARNNGNSNGTVGSNSIGVFRRAIKQDYNMGRFPANFIHDGSDEVVELFPSEAGGGSFSKGSERKATDDNLYKLGFTKHDFVQNAPDNYGDSGNASRFFYTAKASKKDRDEGLGKKEFDCVEIILYNVSKGDDIVWKDTLKTQEVQKAKQSEDMVISLKKAIGEYGTQNNVDIDLNTILYGKKHLEQYLMDTKYTTKMEINLTTIQQTLNLLRHFTTKEFTAVVNSKQTVGGNNVINATNGNTLDIIINEKTEYQVLANSVQLKLQLVIKEKESRNVHPTIKPCELMQYLVRLVTPKNGTVLDPFMGSGSTGKATMFENREREANYKFIGIDLDLDNQYCEIANARIDYALNKFIYDEQEIREQDKAKGQMSIFDLM